MGPGAPAGRGALGLAEPRGVPKTVLAAEVSKVPFGLAT